MSYIIRTCKECGQKVHIRQKGNLLDVKNRCVHFNEPTINRTQLEELAISIEQFRGMGRYKQDIPDICVYHCIPMIFKSYINETMEVHYCPACEIVGKMIPANHIKQWKKYAIKEAWKTGSSFLVPYIHKWKPGDVNLIIITNYATMKERGWITA